MRQTLKPTDDWRVAWEARRDARKRNARQWCQERLRDPEAADRRLAEKHNRIAERDRLIVAKWLAEHPTYAALGREFGISASLVRQIIARADRIAWMAARKARSADQVEAGRPAG